MRRGLGIVLVCLSLVLAPRAGLAQTLWQDTRVGMTSAEIKSKFPDAVVGTRERLYSGATDELRIPDYDIGGRRFAVDFYFAEDKLQQVIVQMTEVKAFDRAANLQTYGRLVELLTGKYGRPHGCQTARNMTWFQGCQWVTGQAKVDVVYVDVGGQPIVLNVYYQANRGPGAVLDGRL